MLLAIAVTSIFVAHFWVKDKKNAIESIAAQEVLEKNLAKEADSAKDNEKEPDMGNAIQEEMIYINSIDDPKEKILTYKEFLYKYPYVADMPETIYDCFTEDELNTLFRVVEAEATSGEFIDKANIVSVIFNRISASEFENAIDSVLVDPEFSSISDGRYKEIEVTEDTILACEYVFMFESTVEDAIFFDSTDGDSWASKNREKIEAIDNIGHNFFR